MVHQLNSDHLSEIQIIKVKIYLNNLDLNLN